MLSAKIWSTRVFPNQKIGNFSVDCPRGLSPIPELGGDLAAEPTCRVPWISFFEDYFGISPRPESADAESNGRAPVVQLRSSAIARSGLHHASGLTVIIRPGARHVNRFRVVQNHPAIWPLQIGDDIAFEGSYTPLRREDLIPLVKDESNNISVALQERPPRAVVYGFDPISALASDTRDDRNPDVTGANANWIAPISSSVVWSSPFIFWKGLWPADVAPLVYSIDTEGAVAYFDRSLDRCVWASKRRIVLNRRDMKVAFSVSTAVKRLEREGLVGTFHIDLNGVLDAVDEAVLAETGRFHDLALHVPRIGTHEAWKTLIKDDVAVEQSIREALAILSRIAEHRVIGFRYASWHRLPSTHDVLDKVSVGYDSSVFAHPPFLTRPFRLFSHFTGEPLGLWEFPCLDVTGAVKAGVPLWRGFRTRRKLTLRVLEFLDACALRQGIAVLCDHDMIMGAALGHIHGTWRRDWISSRRILQKAGRCVRRKSLRPVRAAEFYDWWSWSRAIRFKIEPIIEKRRQSQQVVIRLQGPEDSADKRTAI